MEMLRNFLYLDIDTVSNFLSTLEGYIETEVDESESKEGKIGADGGAPFLKGSAGTSKASSRNRKLTATNESRFQRLYQLLDEHYDKGIPYITSLDHESWTLLSRGSIIEIQARLRLPIVFQAVDAAGTIKPFVDLISLSDEDNPLNKESNQALHGMLAVGEATKDKPVPVFLEPVRARRDAFFCNLTRRHLRCEISELKGELTVLGKITRLIPKGASEEVFTLLSELQNLGDINRKSRRRLKSQQDGIIETLKGPAGIVHPVAIYQ